MEAYEADSVKVLDEEHYEIPEGVERQELTKKREQRIRLVGMFNWFRFLM